MTTYLDLLPYELSATIYHIYLNNLVRSPEFINRRRTIIIKTLQKKLSQKQLRQIGL